MTSVDPIKLQRVFALNQELTRALEALGLPPLGRQECVTRIQLKVANVFNVTFQTLLGRNREGDVVRARHIAMWVARVDEKVTFKALGLAFHRHHAAVMHAVASIRDQLTYDKELQQDVRTVRTQLGYHS